MAAGLDYGPIFVRKDRGLRGWIVGYFGEIGLEDGSLIWFGGVTEAERCCDRAIPVPYDHGLAKREMVTLAEEIVCAHGVIAFLLGLIAVANQQGIMILPSLFGLGKSRPRNNFVALQADAIRQQGLRRRQAA
jgi:hypothetical protein